MTSQIVIATELLVAGRGDHPRGIFSVSVFSTFLVVLKVQGLASLLPPLFLWTSFVFQFEGSDIQGALSSEGEDSQFWGSVSEF